MNETSETFRKIASFDIGIKNMAYCILKTEPIEHLFPYSIQDWKVLNLISDNEMEQKPECTCWKMNQKKQKRQKTIEKKRSNDQKDQIKNNENKDSEKENIINCKKPAKYFLANQNLFFCKKHAIETTENTESPKYLMYSPTFAKSALNKLSVDDLHTFSNRYFPLDTHPKKTKKDTIDHLLQLLQGKCLMPIVAKKKIKAGEADLITIGRNMATLLDNECEMFRDVTHIIIENQISTIAARMKTIQGMLAQYFILRNPGVMIQFVSSMNKLKGLDKLHETTDANASEYKKHKKDGVEYCRRFLARMSVPDGSDPMHRILEWKSLLENSKKKDDLADCFLQGIWYLQKEK
jgi:hypothetical protein